MEEKKHHESGSAGTDDATKAAGEFDWDGLAEEDELPPDTVDPEDPAVLQAMFDWDADQYDPELLGFSESDAGMLSTEDCAAALINSGSDAAARLMESMEPGPETAALLAMLRPAVLSSASMVSAIVATEKLLSWVQARQHRWLAAFACPGVVAPKSALRQYASQPGQPLHSEKRRGAGREQYDDATSHEKSNNTELDVSGSAIHGADPDVDTVLTEVAVKVAAAEVGAALRLAPVTAQRRVCQAVEFAVDLPDTLRAMEGGSIDRGRAAMIAVRTQNLPVELRRRVEQAVLPKAVGRTAGQLQGIVDRAVISVDPSAAKKRHHRAIADRNVSYQSGQDGIGVFRAELAADHAQVAFGVIDQLAEQLNRMPAEFADGRGLCALRADAFSDLFDQLASTGTVSIGRTLEKRARPTASGTCPRGGTEHVGQETAAHGDANQHANGAASEDTNEPTAPIAHQDVDGHGYVDAPQDAVGGKDGKGTSTTVDDGTPASGPASSNGATTAGGESPTGGARSSGGAPLIGGVTSSGGATPSDDNGEHGPVGVGGADDPDQPRTGNSLGSGQPRADCQVTFCESDAKAQLGTAQGRRTHLNVTIDAATLAGLNNRPGDLAGHGPIPADLARAIALSAETITAIVLKADCGSALDLGRTTYRPRLAQRDHVTTRDQTCRFPGCRRASRRCQIDHSDEYCPGEADGGVTCPCNLCCLCAFHHGLKTGGLWDSVQHPDATITWTSPTGRSYGTKPREWPTDDDDEPIRAVSKPVVGEDESRYSEDRGSGDGDQGSVAGASTGQPNSDVQANAIDHGRTEPTADSTKTGYDDEPPF